MPTPKRSVTLQCNRSPVMYLVLSLLWPFYDTLISSCCIFHLANSFVCLHSTPSSPSPSCSPKSSGQRAFFYQAPSLWNNPPYSLCNASSASFKSALKTHLSPSCLCACCCVLLVLCLCACACMCVCVCVCTSVCWKWWERCWIKCCSVFV